MVLLRQGFMLPSWPWTHYVPMVSLSLLPLPPSIGVTKATTTGRSFYILSSFQIDGLKFADISEI